MNEMVISSIGLALRSRSLKMAALTYRIENKMICLAEL